MSLVFDLVRLCVGAFHRILWLFLWDSNYRYYNKLVFHEENCFRFMVQNLMIQIQSKYKFIIVHAPSVVLASLPSYGLYYLLLYVQQNDSILSLSQLFTWVFFKLIHSLKFVVPLGKRSCTLWDSHCALFSHLAEHSKVICPSQKMTNWDEKNLIVYHTVSGQSCLSGL